MGRVTNLDLVSREEGGRGNMGPLTVHSEMKMRRLLAGEDAGRCL